MANEHLCLFCNMRIALTSILVLLITFSCSTSDPSEQGSQKEESSTDNVLNGTWNGQLLITDDQSIPFRFQITVSHKDTTITMQNADERIVMEHHLSGDSLYLKFPVFDSRLFGTIEDGTFQGKWHNYAKGGDYFVPFTAHLDNSGSDDEKCNAGFEGKWETTFSPGKQGEYPALGVFTMEGCNVTGTFLTETGDYRYLWGSADDDSLTVSCFDGAHAFLFKATISDNKLDGMFWSGKHWKEPFVATRNETYSLRDADSLTFLSNNKQIEFELETPDGYNIAYPSEKTDGNVVILQIMGTWCPNCMDETEFLRDLHAKYADQGLNVIAVGFETSSRDSAMTKLEEYAAHFGLRYPVVYGGTASKEAAGKMFPMLNNIISFPTAVFIDRNGTVRKIHTGFAGPGTGKYYTEFVTSTTEFVEQLLSE